MHGDPDLKRPEAPGQLQAPVCEVDLAGAVRGVAFEVVGVDGERPLKTSAVADQHAAAFHGLVEPFMGIQCHRVGAINAGQYRSSLGGESGEAAVGRIDMQPQPFGGAHIGQLSERIDGAGVGRPGTGAQGEGDTARAAVGPDGGGYRVRRKTPAIVSRQYPHLVRAQSHGPCGPSQGRVSLVRHVHHGVGGRPPGSFAGHQQRGEVGRGAAAHEHAGGAGGQAEPRAEPVDDLQLHLGGAG